MPTKQEIICMMENHLPGEPVTIGSPPRQPPAYPALDGTLTTEQMQPLQHGEQNEQVYAITATGAAAPINHPPAQFGARPRLTYCPSCHTQQMTHVDYKSSTMTHIIAAILCCTTCSCCLPYIFDSCKTARHYCPQCDTYLGAEVK